jgi:type IV secretion system protein VirD4
MPDVDELIAAIWRIGIAFLVVAVLLTLGPWTADGFHESDPRLAAIVLRGTWLGLTAFLSLWFFVTTIGIRKPRIAAFVGTASAAAIVLFALWAFGPTIVKLYAVRGFDLPALDRALVAGCTVWLVAWAMLVRVAAGSTGRAGDPVERHRAISSVFGDARWASMEQAAAALPSSGSIVIGERYRVDLEPDASVTFDPRNSETWGRGGAAPLLAFDLDRGIGSGHGLVISGSGGGKTTANVVPTLLRWPGNTVVFDPSIEVMPMVREARAALGDEPRDVFVIDPSIPTGSVNLLDWIGTGTKTAEEDIATVASWFAGSRAEGRDPFFSQMAEALVRGLLAHVHLSPSETDRTLRRLRILMSEGHEQFHASTLEAILKQWSVGSYVHRQLGPFRGMHGATFSGIYSNAGDMTSWLAFPRFADMVSTSSGWKTTDLATKPLDVFVNLPLATVQEHPGLGRVVLGALLNSVHHHDSVRLAAGDEAVVPASKRVLFLVDEAARLQNMQVLTLVRDAGRKYRATLVMIYQSLGQMDSIWSEDGRVAWMDSASWISFSAINSNETAKYVSDRCGTMTVETTSRTVGASARGPTSSANVSVQRRNLINPDEVMRLRGDEQIVFVLAQPPIRCGRAFWFRRPEMRAVVGGNRFHAG